MLVVVLVTKEALAFPNRPVIHLDKTPSQSPPSLEQGLLLRFESLQSFFVRLFKDSTK